MKDSGDRPAREPESASFETARVRPRRGTQPIFILGFIAFVAAFVAVGVGGRSTSAPAVPPVALDSPVATVSSPTESPASEAPHIGPSPAVEPRTYTSGPGPIQLTATRSAGSVFVHGDVFVARTTWVYVSLRDSAGNVAGWASVSVPGAAGPGQGTGPNVRFDAELALPDGFAGPLSINASAYDADSTAIATAVLPIEPLLRPRMEYEP